MLKIAEYGQQEIHLKINQILLLLPRPLCGVGYGIFLSYDHIFPLRHFFLVLLPVLLLVRAMSVFSTTTSFQLYNSMDEIIFIQDGTLHTLQFFFSFFSDILLVL